jgi:hypothetical protein
MKISLEQLGKIRERRKAQDVSRHGIALLAGRHRWVQPVLLIFGVLFVVAFLVDAFRWSRNSGPGGLSQRFLTPGEEIQALERDLAAGQRVKATSGLFSFVVPGGWRMAMGEEVAPYDLMLTSPNIVRIRFSAAAVPFDDLPALFKDMSARERQYNVRTDIQTFYLHGIPAARREVPLMKTKALIIDLVKDRIAHQIFCEVPAELFDLYRPTLLKLIETYQPLSTNQPAAKTP